MERHIEIQRPLVCAASKMTKALPPDISLYLSQATSFHPLIMTPFSRSVSLCLLPSLFSSFRCLCSISRPCPHFMQLFLSSFLSFLPLSNILYPSSASPPPLLIFKPPTLPCLLVFLPLLPSTTTSCRTSLPLTYSVFLHARHLVFHVFSPACCDHSRAGGSRNSRQPSR